MSTPHINIFDHISIAKLKYMKGGIGEALVDEYLLNRGRMTYKPTIENMPHPYDRFVASLDGRKIYLLEIKTKPRRKFYPDTGIDLKHYWIYKKRSQEYNMRILILFVDQYIKSIYGNFLDELERGKLIIHNNKMLKYPLIFKNIIYFPINLMITVANISDKSLELLKSCSTGNYVYH